MATLEFLSEIKFKLGFRRENGNQRKKYSNWKFDASTLEKHLGIQQYWPLH